MVWPKMRRMWVLVLMAYVPAAAPVHRQMCGQVQCQPDEYCSTETNQCLKCYNVCDVSHHNYEAKICNDYCPKAVDPALQKVQIQAQAALIVSCVSLVVLLGVLVFIIRKSCTKNAWKSFSQKYFPAKKRVNRTAVDPHHGNPQAVLPRPRATLVLGMNNSPATLEPAAVETISAKIRSNDAPRVASANKPVRYPAEDTTLDNSCYDNMAMNVTPSPTSNVVSVVGRSF